MQYSLCEEQLAQTLLLKQTVSVTCDFLVKAAHFGFSLPRHEIYNVTWDQIIPSAKRGLGEAEGQNLCEQTAPLGQELMYHRNLPKGWPNLAPYKT